MNIKRLLKNTSPFIIVSILALFACVYLLIMEREGSEAMGSSFIVFQLAVIGIMVAVDLSLKRLQIKLGWIWPIEMILTLACIYWWVIT